MITYAVENWHDVKDEAMPLLLRHWDEIAADKAMIPLDIDYDAYDAIEASGMLHILVARSDGEMIGYFVAIVRGHLHYKSTEMAFTDIFFIAPEWRKGLIGVKLFREMEKSLVARGVVKIFGSTKPKLDIGPIFERLGYHVHETVYSKLIG